MSTTYSIACMDCRQKLEAGYTSRDSPLRITQDPDKLGRFLKNHTGHRLQIVVDCDEGQTALFDDFEA